MNYEDAKREVDEANKEPEAEFCPMTKEKCNKFCKLYKKAHVKSYWFGTAGTSYVGIKSSCGLKR